MRLFQPCAIRLCRRWIADVSERQPRMATRPRVRLDQLDARILADIGMSKLGVPVARL
jgi:hypothetical protein